MPTYTFGPFSELENECGCPDCCGGCVGCHYCPDDCGEDCECADCDIDSFRAALGCTDPDPCYNSQWDFDGDGDVDFSDLATYGDYCDDC